jgi:hypothetical protein
MKSDRREDREMLVSTDKDTLINLLFLQMRNLWAVDGLYFLGIEERFGTEGATDIDRNVWEIMGKIEARRLKELLNIIEKDIPALIKALRYSSWSLDLEDKDVEVDEERAIFRNVKCRVQNTRLSKGLSEFPCKQVRWGYLKNFAKEFNKDIIVECSVCPPDRHPEDLWCEWVFRMHD